MTTDHRTEQKILRCVDEGLETLGDKGRKAVCYHLERNGMKRIEIVKDPERLGKELSTILGKDGASIIENWIVQKLRACFDLKQESLNFAKAIEVIKTNNKNQESREIRR